MIFIFNKTINMHLSIPINSQITIRQISRQKIIPDSFNFDQDIVEFSYNRKLFYARKAINIVHETFTLLIKMPHDNSLVNAFKKKNFFFTVQTLTFRFLSFPLVQSNPNLIFFITEMVASIPKGYFQTCHHKKFELGLLFQDNVR